MKVNPANPPVDGLQGEDATQQKCFVCESEIVDGRWFCRLPFEDKRIILCSPRCALSHFESQNPGSNPDLE
jgi:hypothetical protein